MARSDAVWAIDLGQCALKALRCRPDSDPDKIAADAFDYIEYPKILSQPGADAAELISEALRQFLSRNSVRGDRVAISVPGQSGLARFIKLPPVESKKIPDIVRYEARQQIPFDLSDVIWDYQRIGGGSEEEGFALETEVGLFAMKRDAVFRALDPFQKAGIEVDWVQLAPLALYNFVYFDQLAGLTPPDQYDADSPPDSVVLLSLGTDATDLVVTDGFHVWQRSIPLGGSHFTKALTKELKLTFAKAEHLKRNATAAQDPKAVFQAMRPVFNDLLTELQRSIGYFTGVNRSAKIRRILGLGNAMKLPGLRRYLSQSLGYEVQRLDSFRCLVGPQVLAAPAFKENSLCFGVCYGLALQGLGKSRLWTNLLPKELVQDRLVRQKKPWAVAAAAVLMLACGISFASWAYALAKVDENKWKTAEGKAATTAAESAKLISDEKKAKDQFNGIMEIRNHLVGNVEDRIVWLELLRAIDECLPRDQGERPKDVCRRNELHITNLECQHVSDLATWFSGVKNWYEPPKEPEEPDEAAKSDAATPPTNPAPTPDPGPSGEGWLIRLQGYHYHNLDDQRPNWGSQFVQNTLVDKLNRQSETVMLPTADRTKKKPVSLKELGISYAVLVSHPPLVRDTIPDPNQHAAADDKDANKITVQRCDFIVHFCWKPTPPSDREAQPGKPEP